MERKMLSLITLGGLLFAYPSVWATQLTQSLGPLVGSSAQVSTPISAPLATPQTLRTVLVPMTQMMGGMQPILGAMLTNPMMQGMIPVVVNPIEALMYDFIGPLVKETTGQEPINISGRELNRMIQQTPELQRIDVRTPAEYDQGHIPGAVNIQLQDVNSALQSGEIDKDKPLVFICQSGARSYMAGLLAITYGYEEVNNLLGGTVGGWIEAGLPVEQ
jgi:rhodanese-related sulfurtransferase